MAQAEGPPTTDLPDLTSVPAGPERKAEFIGFLHPIATAENRRIQAVRTRLAALAGSLATGGAARPADAQWLRVLAKRYRLPATGHTPRTLAEALLRRVDVIPPALVLAQAAKESAWGTSRFARQGNNLFGHWCFTPSCGMVPLRRTPGLTHEVATFDSVRASVAEYMRNLNSHKAYAPLRAIRARLRAEGLPLTGTALAAGLTRYSAGGDDYVREVRALIRHNDLERFRVGR